MFGFMERVRARHRNEQGFYMVWFALTFVTLTAFAGLALEFNRWQDLGTKAQKAADSAALGGAVFMPDNVGNKAFTTAQTLAAQNGFTNGSGGVTVTTAVGKLPNQLKVTVSIKTHNPWGALVGYGSTTITRSAVAEYQLPQNLGSPQNIYGNDPESAAAQPQFWGNVFGPSSNKDKGDAIQSAGPPPAAAALCNADNCAGGVNKDYAPNGYFYGIDVPAGTAGPLNVQVYDPAFVHVGDQCGSSDTNAANSLNAAATLTAAQIPGYTGTIPPSTRYASSGTSAFCNGDNYYSDGSNTANPWTLWTLRAPDNSPWDPSNNPIVCQAEFPGVYPETTNNLPNGTVNANELKTLLQQSTAYPGTNPARTFAVVLPPMGDPVLRQQSDAGHLLPRGADQQEDRRHHAHERGRVEPLLDPRRERQRLHDDERPARLRQPDDGHLRQRDRREHAVLPDTGVARRGRQDTRAELLRHRRRRATRHAHDHPTTGLERRGELLGLHLHRTTGNSTGPPWGTFSATDAGCSISVNNASFNGQWVTFEIPVPTTYTCTTSSTTGCWVRLSVVYPSGSVTDTTTWNAYILGEPVRIIQ